MGNNHEITMETRVAILEHDAAEQKQLLRDLHVSQLSQTEMIHGMDKKLDLALARKECPDPGACLKIEPRLRELENAQNQTKGGLKVASLVAGAIGAAFTATVSWVWQHLKEK